MTEKVARKLHDSAGPGALDSITLQHLLLRFGEASHNLIMAMIDFTEWLAYSSPPWEAYHTMMAGRLIALDKWPGIRPV